jgi:hypothetical protein
MRKASAIIAGLAAMTFASAASAAVTVTTFVLDTTDVAAFNTQFPSHNFGTVTVTDNGVDLYIAVALASGLEFRYSPDNNHHDLTFDLKKNGVQDTGHTLTAFTDNVTPHVFSQTAGNSFKNSPFNTGWDYAVDCQPGTKTAAGCTPGWNPAHNPTTMGFKVAGVSVNEIASVPYTPTNTHTTRNIFFAVDVVNSRGATGSIGASSWSQVSYAPEPGAWALMILGFGCVGADLRRRRRIALAA